MFDLHGSTATVMIKFTFAEMAGMRLYYAVDYENEAAFLYAEKFSLSR
jgi:hypothetical protein